MDDKIINIPWYRTWRIVYGLFGIVLIIELILGAKTLLSPLPQFGQSVANTLQLSKGAKISILSPKINFNVGDTIPISIKVDTGGYASSGTDLILRYNSKVLEASSAAFVKGKIYPDYPLVNIDGKSGIIRISGAATSVKQAFNGVGVLGTIKFKAKAKGMNAFRVDFKKTQTNESNIMSVSTNKDILEGVDNLNITVQ